MHAQITTFFRKKSILPNSKYGFKAKGNTKMAEMAQKELVVSSFECKLYTLGIFIAFTKAFYTVNHKILNKNQNDMEFAG